jgi:hypothetical protein
MTYFMNPFHEDFLGVWVIDDRAHHPTFPCPRNAGRGHNIVVAWNEPSGTIPRSFDLSVNDADGNPVKDLTLQFAIGSDFLNWNFLTVDLTDDSNVSFTAVPAAMEPWQIVDILNAHPTFPSYFEASIGHYDEEQVPRDRILIRQKRGVESFKFFIVKGTADEALGFNARAGVAELPTYFDRHTVFNRDATTGLVAFEDGCNVLIELDPSNAGGASAVDDDIIDNAVDAKGNNLGYDSSVVQDDWELVQGQTSTFTFTKVSAAAAASTTTTIEYPAGAKVGDLAKKIVEEFDGGGNLLRKFIMPHTLVSGDLITPP